MLSCSQHKNKQCSWASHAFRIRNPHISRAGGPGRGGEAAGRGEAGRGGLEQSRARRYRPRRSKAVRDSSRASGVEGRLRSSDRSSRWKIGLKIQTTEELRGPGDGWSEGRGSEEEERRFFVLLAEMVEDGREGVFVLRTRRNKESPHLRRRPPHSRRRPPFIFRPISGSTFEAEDRRWADFSFFGAERWESGKDSRAGYGLL